MKRLFAILLICLSATLATAADAPAEAQGLFTKMVEGILAKDAGAITANGDDAFKAAMTPEVVNKAFVSLEGRLKGGYEAIYFGSMKKQGYETYIWKLAFKDGGDDLMCMISMKGGKVGGFVIR